MRLTSIRGIASLIVVLHHAMLLFQIGGRDDTVKVPLQFTDHYLLLQQVLLIVFNGQAAVVLFFVLSGCVLSLSLRRSSTLSVREVAGFYVKRAFRILPTLWLGVFLGLFLLPYDSSAHIGEISTRWMQIAYSRSPTLFEFARHLVAMDSFLDQPLWSLFIELFYSAAFPAIFLLTRKRRHTLAMIALSAVALFVPFAVLRDLNYYLAAFVLGSALANVTPAPKRRSPAVGGALLCVATLLLLASRRILDPLSAPMPIIVLAETCAGATIIYLAMFGVKESRWLENRALVFLGDISFSLYLLHFPLLFVVARWFEQVAGIGFIAGHGMASNLIVGLVTVGIAVLVAATTYRWFERPLQEFGRGLARKLRVSQPVASVRVT